MGCDSSSNSSRAIIKVSIHAPIWGATSAGMRRHSSPPFQFTHPYGVRPAVRKSLRCSSVFQFTHPYGVRRPSETVFDFFELVSIHAPIWGATGSREDSRQEFMVSIHAPIWGATSKTRPVSLRAMCFNSRTHMGCDSCCIDVYYTSICQPYFAKLSN